MSNNFFLQHYKLYLADFILHFSLSSPFSLLVLLIFLFNRVINYLNTTALLSGKKSSKNEHQ